MHKEGELDEILWEMDYSMHVILEKVLISLIFNNYHYWSIREGIAEFKVNVYKYKHIQSQKYGT